VPLLPVVRPVAFPDLGEAAMPEIKLKIADLVLDHENPRITHVEGQQDALQKIVKEQKTKLVKLATSIAEHGLSPADRLLVLRRGPNAFIAVEGNRRTAALRLLTNPAVMSGLDMPLPMKKIFTRLAKEFADKKMKAKIEPIAAFELETRPDGDYWLELRHKGEQDGAGIVDWSTSASHRFRHKSPAMQALEMVTNTLAPDDRAKVVEKFPVSTLQRFVEDRKVRQAIGLDVQKGKLVTLVPPKEAIKPLRKIVRDLATKEKKVGSFMKTDQMLDYVASFDKASRADLSKAKGEARPVEEIAPTEFGAPSRAPRTPRLPASPSARNEVVPKNCRLNVTKNRPSSIYRELRALKLTDTAHVAAAPNAIAVLMRVFLELSLDHFLIENKRPLKVPKGGGAERFKTLQDKLQEVVEIMVAVGVRREEFAAITRSISDKNSPLHYDLLHAYVHDLNSAPLTPTLVAAWDHTQPLLEKIWK
jgi:hypothetical protein